MLEEAKKQGAIGLFESKYGNIVKVYSVPGYSMRFAAARTRPTLPNSGRFEIQKEQSSSAGVRRIKAVLLEIATEIPKVK